MKELIMKLLISGEFYNFEVTVNGHFANVEGSQGWWHVTDGEVNQVMPPFRCKEITKALFRVAEHLLTLIPK